ncbi:Asd/ArgC dimerization domain-containing protein [Parvularcula sp. LCG005]|uniref:Asd/ArgC dimerization domain-containing protein n=1 Tax=Parvularcula sp. LCG005 TaxID=3078805 RepID=UPI002942D2B4|nr:Asd/ArgC dimerization domain-containing protein [Parvularcula sp. LCG005]WOI53058.1 Asd/ArgC dimerization domain-containing protein [Parvularcula sp. LCG005]
MSVRRIGLVGARGYVGREMMALIERDSDFELALATSREHAGRPISSVFDTVSTDLEFSDPSADDIAAAGLDAIVLGLPNGLAAPFVDALDRISPETTIVDLSADYRHKDGWIFGLSDLLADEIKGAKRIANPGCYATAGILPLHPLASLLSGTPALFGLSGYSGAGTTPGPKNDPVRLADNILPYGFAGHGHQGEIGAAIGRPVRFMPHVAQFFRGLIVTIAAPLRDGTDVDEVNERLAGAYADNPTVSVQADVPEIGQVAGTPNAVIGGAAIDPATNMLAIACVHDNLLKGAASQALANLRLSYGLSRGSV